MKGMAFRRPSKIFVGDSASEDEHEADGEIDSSCSSCVVEGRPPARAAISRNRSFPPIKGERTRREASDTVRQ